MGSSWTSLNLPEVSTRGRHITLFIRIMHGKVGSSHSRSSQYGQMETNPNLPKTCHLYHFLFADDLTLFDEASIDQIETIMDCLGEFYSMLGQNLSFQKSSMCVCKNVDKNESTKSPCWLAF